MKQDETSNPLNLPPLSFAWKDGVCFINSIDPIKVGEVRKAPCNEDVWVSVVYDSLHFKADTDVQFHFSESSAKHLVEALAECWWKLVVYGRYTEPLKPLP